MSEAELIESLNGIASVTQTFVSLWITLTFAYLSAAYFVGENLSRFQTIVISTLYVFSAAFFGLGAISYNMAWQKTRSRGGTVFNEIGISGGEDYWIAAIVTFLIAGTLISLYFMHDVRKRRKDGESAT